MSSSSPVSSLSTVSSGSSGACSFEVVDILLAAHRQLTEREFEFTTVMLDALLYLSTNPVRRVPTTLVDKAIANPDLVYAIISSPDVQYETNGLEIGQFFDGLVRWIGRLHCRGENRVTADSYAYLARRPSELAATHRQYRSESAYRRQPSYKGPKCTSRCDRAALIVLSIFLTKKEWRQAKKRVEGGQW